MSLDAISAELSAQNPSSERTLLIKKRKRIEKLGVYFLSISGIIAFSLLLTVAVYYKLAILGPEILFGSAIGALILFLLASILLLGYSKFSMKAERASETLPGETERKPTSKLLNDSPFEPASVTEHSTELLRRRAIGAEKE